MVALQSTDTTLIFPFNTQILPASWSEKNLGDVTKAHFIALSMFDVYSEIKSDRISLPERPVWPTQHHPDLTADI